MKKLFTTAALLLAITAGGAAFANDKPAPEGQPPAPMFEKLSPEDMQLMHDSMQKTHEANKALFAQMKKLHEEKKAIITADQFDSKAFMANAAKLQTLENKMHASMTANMASALSKMSAEDRQKFAKNMEHRMMMWHEGHGMKHSGEMNGMEHHQHMHMQNAPQTGSGDAPTSSDYPDAK